MQNSKLFLVFVLGIFLFGILSAQTPVFGKIYDSGFSNTVSGANIMVYCNGNSLSTTSMNDGAYVVRFDESICNYPSEVRVEASKGELSGSDTGILRPCDGTECDVGDYSSIVNLAIVAPTPSGSGSSGGSSSGSFRGYFNCGNNKCDSGENAKTCPQDCNATNASSTTGAVALEIEEVPELEEDNQEIEKSGGITGAFIAGFEKAKNPFISGAIILIILTLVVLIYRKRKSVSSQ